MAVFKKFSWREGLSSSLPILLMGLLAAGTWWLVRNTPQPEGPQRQVSPKHEVDYEMRRFIARRYGANGVQRAVVEGQVMRHYVDDGSVEIDDVRARGTDAHGRLMHATAQRGVSDAENTEIQLLGQARVVRDAAAVPAGGASAPRKTTDGRTELQGEALWFYPDEQRVHSDIAVTMISEDGQIDAGTLDYDGRLGIGQMSKGVRGQYRAVIKSPGAARP